MIQRIAVFLFILSLPCTSLMAQQKSGRGTADSVVHLSTTPPKISKPARDFLMLQLGYNNWIQKPDSVKTKSVGYVFNAYACYDFPIKKTKLSFAAGLGINTQVVYLDQQIIRNNDTMNYATVVADTSHYKRYKFVTTYLTAPFELRYFSNLDNRNKGFKAALGMQIGTLLGAHTKAVTTFDGTKAIVKDNTKRYLSPWNFAATARVGWGNFAVFGSYNLTNVFRQAEGPTVTPFSAGITLTGL